MSKTVDNEASHIRNSTFFRKLYASACGLKRYGQDQDDRDIDVLHGMRVLFILIVAWYHIWQQSWLTPEPFGVSLDFLLRSGYEWVDAMLLLSGFLLFLPYTGDKRIEPLRFYRKRLIRIVPSYYLCILLLLLIDVLPGHKYASFFQGFQDVLRHMTFTHNLSAYSYLSSPLNGVLWTLAVEMQFYLLFPVLAFCFRNRPVVTWALMTALAFGYRAYVSRTFTDTSLYINQLPAFMDVYANGFLAASIYTALRKILAGRQSGLTRLLFSVSAAVCLVCVIRLLKDQAASAGIGAIRQGQMDRRFSLSALLSVMMVSLPFSLTAIRFLLGNRVMRFLSSITFQFYMYHQELAVLLKNYRIPAYTGENPNMTGQTDWQNKYTWLVFLITLLLSVLITLFFEKPVARLLGRNRSTNGKNTQGSISQT